jgi:hypothetical protein
MPDKKWAFDTVTISNFLLSESINILEARYKNRAIITIQVLDELSAGISKYPNFMVIDCLIEKKYLIYVP